MLQLTPQKKTSNPLENKSDDPRLDHLDEYPRSGDPNDGWEIVELWFDHIWSMWIEVNWIELNCIEYGIMYMWLAIVCQQTDTDDSIAYAAIGIEIQNLMDVLR